MFEIPLVCPKRSLLSGVAVFSKSLELGNTDPCSRLPLHLSILANMDGSGQRRGKAEHLRKTLSSETPGLQKVGVNGKPKINGTVGKIGHMIERQENIFLFIPNVIGQSR